MTRLTAYQMLTKYLTNPVLLKHSLATEATMRSLALRLSEDVDEWGITGLLHDADYEKSKGQPEKHGVFLFKLEPNSIPTTIEHAIKAHNYACTHVLPTTKMDWGITCCDELTGIILALASMQPIQQDASAATMQSGLIQLTPELVIENLQQKNFLKEADRKNILLCEEKLGIPLTEFVSITLSAMQSIAQELGL